MKNKKELAEKIGIQFEEAVELFSEETLLSMQMASIIGAGQNGCSDTSDCKDTSCTNNGCSTPVSKEQDGCKNSGCTASGCSYSTGTPKP